ncbi:MAG: TetR/AcrR family transcriptional regulator [Clostridia bacterium]|nr:TetR/AcrR family transcriptional regulator [Clostridia bacterium]
MENEYISDTVRDKLIIEGANEISRNGIANFSLRRVAAACNISCAAPYKHFKNKEELILEIVRYINRQWELLCGQVLSLFENDPRRQLTEICIAYVRFWVANPNYRSVLSASEKEMRITEHATSVEDLIRRYCESNGDDFDETERTVYALKAILYGMTTMMESGELQNVPKTYDYIRVTVEKELM